MRDKQIIIDGVNITGCTWCDFEPDAEPYCRINDGEDLACEDNPNCYFKQLARKTQECEELKERLVRTEEDLKYQCVDCMNVKSDRYREALEEIEKQCKCYGRSKYTQEFDREYGGELDTNILDIINKAKDKFNEIYRKL